MLCLLGGLGTLPSLFTQSALPRRSGSGAKWEGAVHPPGHRQAGVRLDRAEPGAAGRRHLRGRALRREPPSHRQGRLGFYLGAAGERGALGRALALQLPPGLASAQEREDVGVCVACPQGTARAQKRTSFWEAPSGCRVLGCPPPHLPDADPACSQSRGDSDVRKGRGTVSGAEG